MGEGEETKMILITEVLDWEQKTIQNTEQGRKQNSVLTPTLRGNRIKVQISSRHIV